MAEHVYNSSDPAPVDAKAGGRILQSAKSDHTTPRRPLAAAVIAAAAVAFARPASSAIVTIGRPQDDGADAVLIAACRQHDINTRAVDAADDLEDEDPLWTTFDATKDAISAAKPRTLAGMAAKAEAAIKVATDPSGKINPSDTMAEHWAWDLVNDLVRLGGRA